MPIDLGNSPTGTPPTAEEKTQILSALGIPDVSTRSGAENLSNKTLVSPAFSGTATGQLDMPTQVMSADSSVVTRSLLAAEMNQNFLAPISWNTPVATGGTTSGQTVGIACTLSTGNSSSAGNNVYVTDFDNIHNNSGSGVNNRLLGSQFSLLFDLQCNGMNGVEYRFLYGVAAGATALTAAGFGIVWVNTTTVRIQFHNGTALQETANLTIPSFSIGTFNRYMITWNGATLSLFNKAFGTNAQAPRWSLIGSLTPTGVPTTASGVKMVFANVLTGSTSGVNFTLRIRSAYMAPFV
jgi:hypothetical protein